ncbi:MAG: cation transporter dimerization domain-containing protein, partial [Chloroflexota bacterium]
EGGLGREIRAITSAVRGVSRVGDVRAHRFGPYLVLQVEIDVDPHLSVERGHAIACEVEQSLMAEIEPVRRVYTHVNPADMR